MKNVELFALYEVRKGLYLDVKNKISKIQTDIAKLNTQIRSSDMTKEIRGKVADQDAIISVRDKKQKLLITLYKDFSYNKKLYKESKYEIEQLKKLYDDPDIYSKEKNIFYIYYFSQFSRPRKSLEKISHILNLSYDYIRRLSSELNISLYKSVIKLKDNDVT